MSLELLRRLSRQNDRKMVLLVLDGVGDLRTASQPRTALEAAAIPNLDRLAAAGSTGRILPVDFGITPGSGPGHLSLFGYDPREPEADIGRGVLEALGVDLPIRAGDVAARGNFATADANGDLSDRRAGRITTEECRRLVEKLEEAIPSGLGVDVTLRAGEGHRFVLVLRGEGLSPDIADTDPQRLGVPPRPVRARDPDAEPTARRVQRLVGAFQETLAEEEKANRILLRGFSTLPELPSLPELYQIRCGAFAGYPLYRGVASVCGMEKVPCGKELPDLLERVREHWDRFDFFFLHVKQTDSAGEDGDLAGKIDALEAVDSAVPGLLDLEPDVLVVTGDHSTPTPMKAHSWHPVPVLLTAATAFVDSVERFDEVSVTGGHLGTFPSRKLFSLMLAHAGRLAKYGA